jgi:hypothetical protein
MAKSLSRLEKALLTGALVVSVIVITDSVKDSINGYAPPVHSETSFQSYLDSFGNSLTESARIRSDGYKKMLKLDFD